MSKLKVQYAKIIECGDVVIRLQLGVERILDEEEWRRYELAPSIEADLRVWQAQWQSYEAERGEIMLVHKIHMHDQLEQWRQECADADETGARRPPRPPERQPQLPDEPKPVAAERTLSDLRNAWWHFGAVDADTEVQLAVIDGEWMGVPKLVTCGHVVSLVGRIACSCAAEDEQVLDIIRLVGRPGLAAVLRQRQLLPEEPKESRSEEQPMLV